MEMQKMGGTASHLNDENAKHKAVVESVYSKWLGDGFPDRCGEGLAVQSAIRACSGMDGKAQSVAPSGSMLGLSRKALSDRTKGGKGDGANKRMLSNRK